MYVGVCSRGANIYLPPSTVSDLSLPTLSEGPMIIFEVRFVKRYHSYFRHFVHFERGSHSRFTAVFCPKPSCRVCEDSTCSISSYVNVLVGILCSCDNTISCQRENGDEMMLTRYLWCHEVGWLVTGIKFVEVGRLLGKLLLSKMVRSIFV